MDNALLQKLAELLIPKIDELRNKNITKEIDKFDPSTWPPELHGAWEKSALECQVKSRDMINPSKIDTGGSSADCDGGM